MINYIGHCISLGDIYSRGVINDNVSVQQSPLKDSPNYVVFARSGFNVKSGPELVPSPEDDWVEERSSEQASRGWRKIDPICSNVSLEEALRVANIEAKTRSCVLLRAERDALSEQIGWHPDGWTPVEG